MLVTSHLLRNQRDYLGEHELALALGHDVLGYVAWETVFFQIVKKTL